MSKTTPMRHLLSAVAQDMASQGFKRVAGRNIILRTFDSGNTAIVEVQASRESTPQSLWVAINYGVYSKRLVAKLGEDESYGHDITGAHWRRRLGEAESRQEVVLGQFRHWKGGREDCA